MARSLYNASVAARDKAYEMYRYQAGNMHRMFMIPWITQHCLEMQELLGDDWFSYGLKKNYKPLDTFLRYHYEQGLSKRRFKPGGPVRARIARRRSMIHFRHESP